MTEIPADDDRCPCGSGLTFAECCAPILRGTRKPGSAEMLMRSRFTAFSIDDRDYLLDSWHPRTRPRNLVLDRSMRWIRLEIESASAGGPFDTTGEVVFAAHYTVNGVRGILHERSRFEKYDGVWVYVDGVVEP
ncbi:YchJ family metal-binding protein [Gordonia sp. CPCC 205515]|uniref:YchJ family protein n=1 Tax=Gordonia sp. CPCC 205515 TaxID=3140791 RepID=UPI003AF3C442